MLAVGLAQICITLDYFALNVALPDMAVSLGVDATTMQWALSAYLLAFGALLILGGRLGDVYGRRRGTLIGTAVFGGASLLCGLAPGFEVLVAGRVLQGAGAALLFPSSLALLANAASGAARARTIGLVVGVTTAGTAFGPFVGGLLTQALDWRYVFFVNVPVAIAAILIGRAVLAESRDPRATRGRDPLGLVCVVAGLVSLILGIDRASDVGWSATSPIVLMAAGVALLALFLLVESRVEAPLLDLALLRNRPFVTLTGAGVLNQFAFSGVVFASTLYLQEIRGLSPLEAGAVFLAFSGMGAVSGPLAGRLARSVPVPVCMAAGLALGAGATAALALVAGWPAYLVAFALAGFSISLVYTLTTTGTLAAVTDRETGSASGVTLTGLMTAGALAIAVSATVIQLVGNPDGVDEARGIEAALFVCAAALAAGLPLLGTLRWARSRVSR